MAAEHHTGSHSKKVEGAQMGNKHYNSLLLMAVLSFAAMFLLMYAMVDKVANVYFNFNQFYMAGLMAAAMVIIELALMRAMYQNKKLNTAIIAASLVALIGFGLLIRQQTAISDQQFLRSMIPHHAAAILMCEKAPIEDPEIKELCGAILSSQQEQIDQMRAKLDEMEK